MVVDPAVGVNVSAVLAATDRGVIYVSLSPPIVGTINTVEAESFSVTIVVVVPVFLHCTPLTNMRIPLPWAAMIVAAAVVAVLPEPVRLVPFTGAAAETGAMRAANATMTMIGLVSFTVEPPQGIC